MSQKVDNPSPRFRNLELVLPSEQNLRNSFLEKKRSVAETLAMP